MVVARATARIPVYEETIDEIVGHPLRQGPAAVPQGLGRRSGRPLRSLLRTPVFVPESMSVDDLLHEFQRRKVHIAIVLDEYGGTAGLVTIEDLLEEIVGEIQDEYDVEEPLIVRLSDDEARIDGRARRRRPGRAVRHAPSGSRTRTSTTRSAGSSTTGSAACPKPGDQVQVDGLTLTVETTDGRRVGKVLVVRERRRTSEPPRTTRPTARRPGARSGADHRDDDLLEVLARAPARRRPPRRARRAPRRDSGGPGRGCTRGRRSARGSRRSRRPRRRSDPAVAYSSASRARSSGPACSKA